MPAAIRTVLVPTDFSDFADLAFAHALRLAVAIEGELDIVHVEPNNATADWHWGPKVIATLRRWGYVGPDATATDLAAHGLRVKQSVLGGSTAEHAILESVAEAHADLLVMATHGRGGVQRWLEPSATEAVLRRRAVPFLLIPAGCQGFVDLETGESRLRRVLLPFDRTPDPSPGLEAATALLRAVGGPATQLATLHVGSGLLPADWLPAEPGREVFHWHARGDVIGEILETARTWSADLLVVVSEGRRNFLDELRGSTVERLVASAHTPLLVVPSDWGHTDLT